MNKKVLYVCGGIIFVSAISYAIYKTIKKKREDSEFKKENEEIKEALDKELEENNYIPPKEIKECLMKNWNKPPIACDIADTKEEEKDFEEEMAENEHPLDDDEEESEVDEDELEILKKDFEDEKFYKENKTKPPKIVKASSLGDLPGSFETIEWLYFAEDDVVTDENEVVVEDYERFIGGLLDKFGFRDDDSQEEIYILSYEFRCVYHVTKYFVSYSDKKGQYGDTFNDLAASYGTSEVEDDDGEE